LNPLVSVIMPTYNHAQFLGRALQSVLDQTYPHWEALVIDNHSQDHTDDVIDSFGDSRIHLFKIHNHGVIAASRNLGIRNARGEWIAFLDADDLWYSKKLKVMMTVINADNAYEVLCNDEMIVDIKTGVSRVSRYGPYQKDFYKVLLIEGNRLSSSATVVRRNFLIQNGLAFDELQDYITVEDYGLWLNLARAGARFKFTHDVQGEYVIHENNNSAQLSRYWKNSEALLHHHVFNVQQFHASPDRLWELISTRLRLEQARQCIRERQLRTALHLVLKTLIKFPSGTLIYLLSKLRRYFGKISP